MTAIWPSSLPRPERQPYGRQPDEARLERKAETGPLAFRRRFSSVARLVALSIDIDRNQKAIFDRFYETDTKEGSLPFSMPDPTTHEWLLFTADGQQILAVDGTPILLTAHWLCVFGKSRPSEAIRGVRFQISFQVAVMP